MQCLRVGVGLSEAYMRGTLGSLPVRLQGPAMPSELCRAHILSTGKPERDYICCCFAVQNPSTLEKLNQEPAGQGS